MSAPNHGERCPACGIICNPGACKDDFYCCPKCRLLPRNVIYDDPHELAAALEEAVQDSWFADRDPDTSDDAKRRARAASYRLAGLAMHNGTRIIAALRGEK